MTTNDNKSQLMTVRALVPFLAISFGLTWGLALLMILIPELITSNCNFKPGKMLTGKNSITEVLMPGDGKS